MKNSFSFTVPRTLFFKILKNTLTLKKLPYNILSPKYPHYKPKTSGALHRCISQITVFREKEWSSEIRFK